MDIQKQYLGGRAPLAPFKASFKDPFKTHPPTGIVSLFTTILNLILLYVLKIHKECSDSMVHEGLNTSICDDQCDYRSEPLIKKLGLDVGM